MWTKYTEHKREEKCVAIRKKEKRRRESDRKEIKIVNRKIHTDITEEGKWK